MIRKTGSLVLLAVSGDLAQILSTSFNLRYLQQYVTEKVKQVHVKEYEKKRTVVCLKCQRLSYTVLWSQLFRILALNHLAAHNALVGELILWKWLIILSFFPFKFIHSMHLQKYGIRGVCKLQSLFWGHPHKIRCPNIRTTNDVNMLWGQWYIESAVTCTQSYFSYNGCMFLWQTKIQRNDHLQTKELNCTQFNLSHQLPHICTVYIHVM